MKHFESRETTKNRFQGEFEFISPKEELYKETIEYLQKVQSRRSSESSIFIPTGLGTIITPDKNNIIFSIYGAPQNSVYDIPPLEGAFDTAETSDVKVCGATTMRFSDGTILLSHAGGPDAIRILTARGLQIAHENGVNLDQQLKILLFFNHNQGHDVYISGDMSFKQKLLDMAKRLNLNLYISHHEIAPIPNKE